MQESQHRRGASENQPRPDITITSEETTRSAPLTKTFWMIGDSVPARHACHVLWLALRIKWDALRKFSWAEYCLIWMDEHKELIELRLSAHAYLLTIRCYRRFVDFLQDSDKEYKVNIVTTTEIIWLGRLCAHNAQRYLRNLQRTGKKKSKCKNGIWQLSSKSSQKSKLTANTKNPINNNKNKHKR